MNTAKTNRLPKSSAMDWVRNPISFAIWWVIPIVAGVLTDFLPLSQSAAALIWAGALAWMGLGCVLNARRCHRRHCYFSGPVLLAGAIVVAVHGWGLVPLGPNGLNLTLWTTFGLVALSFLPELVWGRYSQR